MTKFTNNFHDREITIRAEEDSPCITVAADKTTLFDRILYAAVWTLAALAIPAILMIAVATA